MTTSTPTPEPASDQDDSDASAGERLATAAELDNEHKGPGWRLPRTAMVAAGVLLAVAAGTAFLVASMQPTPLESAAESCSLESSEYASLGDDGHTLTIDGESETGGDGLSFTDTACVLAELETSSAALAQMDGTNSLQGRQTATWDGIVASWTYHPDDGFDLILTTGPN